MVLWKLSPEMEAHILTLCRCWVEELGVPDHVKLETSIVNLSQKCLDFPVDQRRERVGNYISRVS